VRGGDTLSSIAKKFGSTVDWVQNANEIASPLQLQAGRKLFIPHN
jgi:LysM repeat protein